MSDFLRHLRSEIEYISLNQKEFAAKAGIKKWAFSVFFTEEVIHAASRHCVKNRVNSQSFGGVFIYRKGIPPVCRHFRLFPVQGHSRRFGSFSRSNP